MHPLFGSLFFRYRSVIARVRETQGDRAFLDCWREATTLEPTTEYYDVTNDENSMLAAQAIWRADGRKVEVTSEVARNLSRYVKWLWDWNGFSAQELWPYGKISDASLYRLLSGKSYNWDSQIAAKMVEFFAYCGYRSFDDVWREAMSSPTQHLLARYDGDGGCIRRQFAVAHSGHKLHNELMGHEINGRCSMTYQEVPDLGLLHEDLVKHFAAAHCYGDCHSGPNAITPAGGKEVRNFARQRRKQLLRDHGRDPASRVFQMPLDSFERFARSEGVFAGYDQTAVRESLEFLTDDLLAKDRLQFAIFPRPTHHRGIYPPALKLSMWGAGALDCLDPVDRPIQTPLGFFAHYHVVDNGRFELARPHGTALCHVYAAPTASRQKSYAGFHWRWLRSNLGRLCHRPDSKSTREFIYRYMRGRVTAQKMRPRQDERTQTAHSESLTPRSRGRANVATFIEGLNRVK